MQFIKKSLYKIILIAFLISIPILSFAKPVGLNLPSNSGTTPVRIVNPLEGKGIDSIQGLIAVFLKGVLQVGIPIVALAIIYCGFLFVSARGNSEKLGKAKEALLYTLIGAAILLGSWAIAQLISDTVIGLSK